MPGTYKDARLPDAAAVASKLAELPKEALLYVAGYVEGCRDRPKEEEKKGE